MFPSYKLYNTEYKLKPAFDGNVKLVLNVV